MKGRVASVHTQSREFSGYLIPGSPEARKSFFQMIDAPASMLRYEYVSDEAHRRSYGSLPNTTVTKNEPFYFSAFFQIILVHVLRGTYEARR
jgi:hypothetical protein